MEFIFPFVVFIFKAILKDLQFLLLVDNQGFHVDFLSRLRIRFFFHFFKKLLVLLLKHLFFIVGLIDEFVLKFNSFLQILNVFLNVRHLLLIAEDKAAIFAILFADL